MRNCWNWQTGSVEVAVFMRACGFKSHVPHHEPLRTKFHKTIEKVGVINPNHLIETMIADWVRDYLSCNLSNNRNRMCSWLTLRPPYALVPQSVEGIGLEPIKCGSESHREYHLENFCFEWWHIWRTDRPSIHK